MHRQLQSPSSALAVLVLLLAWGCGQQAQLPTSASTSTWALERAFPAGPVTLTLRLSATKAELTEQVVLEERLACDDGFEAELPDWVAGDFAGFGVVAVERNSQAAHGPHGSVRRFILEPEKTGTCEIAERFVYFHKVDQDQELHVSSEPLSVEIEIPATTALEPPAPRPALPLPSRLTRTSYLALALGGMLGVATLIWWLSRKQKPVAAPVTPPDQIALAEIAQLKPLQLPPEPYLEALISILRRYLAARFGIEAPQRTTQELLALLEEHDDAQLHQGFMVHQGFMAQLLYAADAVKFAREHTEQSVIDDAQSSVIHFVEATAHG